VHAILSSPAPWSQGAVRSAPVEANALTTRQADRGVRRPSRRAVRPDARPVRAPVATSPVITLPAPGALPPSGAGGTTAGGAAAAAGAGAAALLVLIALYGMRALLPGLLALGPGRWRSALLVCRLERPG